MLHNLIIFSQFLQIKMQLTILEIELQMVQVKTYGGG